MVCKVFLRCSNKGAADLKIGVLIDDIKGRFCVDCPSLFNPKGVPATVVMTAHWEIYSSLDRRVVAGRHGLGHRRERGDRVVARFGQHVDLAPFGRQIAGSAGIGEERHRCLRVDEDEVAGAAQLRGGELGEVAQPVDR